MAKKIGDKVVMRTPSGGISLIAQDDYNSYLQRGYAPASDEEASSVQQEQIAKLGPLKSIQSGLADAPALDTDQATTAAFESLAGSATFGLAGPRDEQAQLRAQLFEDQYPISAFAVQTLPSVAAYAALPGLSAATSTAGKAAAFLGRAALEGSMYAGEAARREGRDFSFTEAAISGMTGEVFGAALGWTATRAAGGYRNLVKGATERSVARDVEKGLGGGWIKDYQAAAYADDYLAEASRAATKDLDGVLTDFPEVASIARKRDRIAEVITNNPNGQRAFASDLTTKLTDLRQTLADTAGEGGGPAKALFKDLDNIIEEWHSLSANLRQTDGKEIFKQADKLRQTVHEYVADIAQDLYADPARAILSKQGLTVLEGFRDTLVGGLKDANVWGAAAADFQKVYNEAFHTKFFPAQRIVNGRLLQVTGKDARGFAVRQAEGGKIMRMLKREASPEETAAGLSAEMTRTHFNNWLDGIETIALEAASEAPDKAKKLLQHVQRLRNTAVVGDQIQDAVARHGKRAAKAEIAGGAALALGGLGDVAGAYFMGKMARQGVAGIRQAHWLGDALNKVGFFKGKKASIEAILNKGTDIIDRRIAGANMRQALKRPAKAMLPEGQADEFYNLGKGPKALPAWEREVDLTNEAEFLGPHTLRPSEYSLDDPAPTPRVPFGEAATEPVGGGTAKGMFVTRQELDELKAELRQSGPQGAKVADFLDEHDAELPSVGRPKVDVDASTAPLERPRTEARPDEGEMPAWPTRMPENEARLLQSSSSGREGTSDFIREMEGRESELDDVIRPNDFEGGEAFLKTGPETAEARRQADLDEKLAAWKAEQQAKFQPWAEGARNGYIADLFEATKANFRDKADFDKALLLEHPRALNRLDMVQAGDANKLAAGKILKGRAEFDLVDLDAAEKFMKKWGPGGTVKAAEPAVKSLEQIKKELRDRGFGGPSARELDEAGLRMKHAEIIGSRRLYIPLDKETKSFTASDFPDLKLDSSLQKQFMAEKSVGRGGHGITNGGWFIGKDGIQRYVKIHKDPAHALSEYLASTRFYPDFGLDTHSATLFPVTQGGKTYLAYASEALPMEWDKLPKLAGKIQRQAMEAYGRDIPVNVLFGDWDKLENPGNLFTNGVKIKHLDNGGAGVFHASNEYRFVHSRPDPNARVGMRQVSGPMSDTAVAGGAKQRDPNMGPNVDWENLETAVADMQPKPDGGLNPPATMPGQFLAKVLGIQSRTELKPLIEQGFERILAVKQQFGGWFEYVEARAAELPKQYKRDLVQLLTSREDWLRKNIPFLSVAPFLGLPAINDLAESMGNAEQDGLASMPSEPWINAVESARRDQEKLQSDIVSNLFGGNRRSRVLSSSVSRFKEDQPDLRTAYLEKRARLEALVNNPGELVSRVTEGFRDMPQEAFAASAGGVGRTVAFLQGKFPQRPPEWQRSVPVGDMQMREVAEYWDAATNPRGALEDFRDTGRLTQPQLETLKHLYPDQFLKLQVGIMEKLQDGPPKSLEARKQVERILGQTGAAEPAFSKTVAYAANAAYEQAAQVQTPPAPSGGASKASAASAQPAGIAALRRA